MFFMRMINLLILSSVLLAASSVYAVDPINEIGQGVGDAVGGLGDAMTDVGEDTVDYSADSVITTQVKTRLALESNNFLQVAVTTIKGVVHLDGEVDSAAQKSRVIEIARSVSGVKEVDASKLIIQPN